MGITNNKKTNRDGLIWIKDQKILVQDCGNGGLPPTLVPCDNATLLIDGQVYNHIVIVNIQSNIEVKLKEELLEPGIKITVSKDGLFAYLHFKPGTKKMQKLKDQEPQNSLKIEVEEGLIEPFNNLTKEKIYKKLSESKITFGIDENVIENILYAYKEETFTIAKGIPPTPGGDSYVELLFENEPTKKSPVEDEEGIIDYKDILSFTNVKENDVLAIKHEGTKGRDGITVIKERIESKPSKDIKLIAGNGVVIEDDGLIAKALISGMPKMTEKNGNILLEISRLLQINQNVDLETGNINYAESIFINGNVCESMQVSSFSDIYIKDNVSFAKVFTPGNIEIGGNAISSYIASGVSYSAEVTLSETLKELDKSLEQMHAIINELTNKPFFKVGDIESKGVGVVVRLILNSKLKDLPQKVYNLLINSKQGVYGLHNELAFEMFEILKVFLTDCSSLKTLEDLNSIEVTLKDYIKRCFIEIGNSHIVLNYALNSQIFADGTVRVLGKGCYNTKIHSKNEVIVSGSFIGGEIFALKTVRLSHVGSDIGVKSIISTSEKGVIFVNKINEGNVIKIGSQIYKFESTEYAVTARLVNNKIVLR